MNKPLCAHKSVSGFFDCFEDSDANIGDEFSATVSRNSHREIGFLAAAAVPVLHVHGHGNVAQIGDCVVDLVSVNVVDLSVRPDTVRHEPSEAMKLNLLAVDCDLPISSLNGSGLFSNSGEALLYAPRKYAGKWVVVEKFLGSGKRDDGHFHFGSSVFVN